MFRRNFLKSVVGGAVAGVGPAIVQAQSSSLKAGDIPRRKFGKTGEELTIIGQAGGRFPLISEEEARAIVLRAYDLGINYFDNAHGYWNGRSEEVYGHVLPPFRKKVFITSKSTKRTAKEAEAELDLSLKRLKTDYLDLWQIHAVNEKEEVARIFGPGGAIEAFEAAKKAGKCRFIGFTGHHDPGIQGMKNFGNAKLLQSLSARECLTYVLSLPIHCTAIGCTTIGQLEDDVRIAQAFKPFDSEQMAAVRKRAERIKGPGLEDWKRNVEKQASLGSRPVYAGG
jgi:predicted aldo/keto reductase-like oxidoreductase